MTSYYTYNPGVFNVENMKHAQHVILTPECGMTSEERWMTEADHIERDFISKFNLNEQSVVLDYGCGIGRLPQKIINKYKSWVLGADISPSMRALACNFVPSDKFAVCHPNFLINSGFKCDLVLAIWVLQHCFRPHEDIANIKQVLKPGGTLFVVNNLNRVVPILMNGKYEWGDDQLDMQKLLAEHFSVISINKLDPKVVTEVASSRTFVGIYQNAAGDTV